MTGGVWIALIIYLLADGNADYAHAKAEGLAECVTEASLTKADLEGVIPVTWVCLGPDGEVVKESEAAELMMQQ